MNKKIKGLLSLILLITLSSVQAAWDRTQLVVWANEAIVATYTYDYKNFLEQQKDIAKYFSSDGWLTYSKALADSKLPDSVQKNQYYVTAVATQPPVLTTLDPSHWTVVMPVLVLYQNPQYQQQQYLNVTIDFSLASSGSGVRGLSITRLQASETKPSCTCPTKL